MTTFLAFLSGGIGWPELLLIGFVALIVFGPRRLPEIADAFGASIKRFRKATKDVKDEVRREINATDAEASDAADSSSAKEHDEE